jgi:two-component system, NarL family, response regulator DegU
MENVNLLVVDDHQLFRKSLVSLLAIFPINLTFFEAGSGLEALDKLNSDQIDIVLLDIQMPSLNGIDCLRKIKELHPQVKVIILTQFDEPALIVHVVALGADGFLLKDTSPNELEKAIATVIQDGQYFTELVHETLVLNLGKNGERLAQLDISPREFQVANLLKDGLGTSEIANKLGLASATISSYRKSIMDKTRCKNVAELVKLLFTTGLAVTNKAR